jgi:hypothetical protein
MLWSVRLRTGLFGDEHFWRWAGAWVRGCAHAEKRDHRRLLPFLTAARAIGPMLAPIDRKARVLTSGGTGWCGVRCSGWRLRA